MNEEKAKEYLFLAYQKGKEETSGLVSEVKRQVSVTVAHLEDMKSDIAEIKVQTTTTNGKVAEIEKWRERVTGASYLLVLLFLPIFSWAIYTLVNLPRLIQEGIKNELSK